MKNFTPKILLFLLISTFCTNNVQSYTRQNLKDVNCACSVFNCFHDICNIINVFKHPAENTLARGLGLDTAFNISEGGNNLLSVALEKNKSFLPTLLFTVSKMLPVAKDGDSRSGEAFFSIFYIGIIQYLIKKVVGQFLFTTYPGKNLRIKRRVYRTVCFSLVDAFCHAYELYVKESGSSGCFVKWLLSGGGRQYGAEKQDFAVKAIGSCLAFFFTRGFLEFVGEKIIQNASDDIDKQEKDKEESIHNV